MSRKKRPVPIRRRPALSYQARSDIINAEIKRAEENLLKSEIALSMAEEVEDLIPEGEASSLEQKKQDVEGWARIVRRLREEYLEESADDDVVADDVDA